MYTITINEQQLPIVVKKHATSRRITIRYKHAKKCVCLTLPKGANLKQGLAFVQAKSDWIARQIGAFSKEENSLADGKIITVLGESLTVKYIEGRGVVSAGDGVLNVYGNEEFRERRVRMWLQKKCAAEIAVFAEKFCTQLGVKSGKITMRDTSSRWGSCSSTGNLSFSWRLVFAPREVLEYVVGHEVSHIREHNHSPAFWAIVTQICPEWKKQRDWLKRHGKTLHAW